MAPGLSTPRYPGVAGDATGVRAHRDLGVLAGPLPVLVVGFVMAVAEATGRAWRPIDAGSYWDASFRLGNLYAPAWTAEAYNYAGPPPIPQAVSLIHWLPYELVLVAWITFLFGCLWYATRAFALPLIVLGLVAIRFELPLVGAPLAIILLGNAGMALTAGVVASVRHPTASAVPFAAKLGPAVALLYHRDRRAFLRGVAAIGLLLAVSVAFSPTAWPDFAAFVLRSGFTVPIGGFPVPFVVRAPLGVLLVLIAGRRKIPWLVPIGAGLCIPAEYGSSFLTVWVGALAWAGRD